MTWWQIADNAFQRLIGLCPIICNLPLKEEGIIYKCHLILEYHNDNFLSMEHSALKEDMYGQKTNLGKESEREG